VIRVLVVASSVVMQAGLAALLSSSSALSVVGTAASLTTEQLTTLHPDIVLLEWDLTDEEGAIALPLAENSLAEASQVGFVLLLEEVSGTWLSEVLHAPIRGILPQAATAIEIISAVEAAAAGLTVLHPDLIESLLPSLPIAPRPLPAVQPLSPREIEVLEMLAEGLGNKTIAKRLHISEHTVKFHVGSIFSKLHVSSRTEAVTIGARQGLILL
jgi:two-component system, NarL family, response regulator YdfI